MTVETYSAARGAAAKFAAAPLAQEFVLTRGIPVTLPDVKNAIYIACDTDGAVRYVGSSIRSVRRRLTEHLGERERAGAWKSLWVLPLDEALPEPLVRLCEARVGRLLRPTENRRLPRC